VSITPEEFRDAMRRWASGVTIVAVRYEGRVVATTVSAFLSLSLRPPLVLVAIGANATILPFLQPGTRFGISILGEHQRRLATIYADPFPVGLSPFSTDGDPVIADALVGLACTVTETRQGGDHVIATASVDAVAVSGSGEPLIRFDRAYRTLST
jgi:flavin reductase (NADH)